MSDQESELRQNSSPDESYLEQRKKLNLLFHHGLITQNELLVGLGGKKVVGGDRFIDELHQVDRPQHQYSSVSRCLSF